jgi:hypothetical protein
VSSNVGSRVTGSEDHVIVTLLRIATAAVLFVLAALAATAQMRRDRRRARGVVVLAAAPIALVLLQAYGGEIALRVYLFALPFVAVLVASMLAHRARRPWPRNAVEIGAVSLLLAAAFLFTRYGNERIELFTRGEVQATERMYAMARPGAVLVAPNSSLPWEYKGIGDYRHRTLTRELEDDGTRTAGNPALLAATVARLIESQDENAAGGYVILARNSTEYEHLFGSAPWGTIAELRSGLLASPSFRRVYASPDAEIFALRVPLSGAGQ